MTEGCFYNLLLILSLGFPLKTNKGGNLIPFPKSVNRTVILIFSVVKVRIFICFSPILAIVFLAHNSNHIGVSSVFPIFSILS